MRIGFLVYPNCSLMGLAVTSVFEMANLMRKNGRQCERISKLSLMDGNQLSTVLRVYIKPPRALSLSPPVITSPSVTTRPLPSERSSSINAESMETTGAAYVGCGGGLSTPAHHAIEESCRYIGS